MSTREKYVALVTGGNRGIGYATCNELLQLGCQVVLTSRNKTSGRNAVARLDAGDNVAFHKLDVTNVEEIEELYDWIVNRYRRLDILINNAAVYLDEGISLFNLEEKTMRDTLETNFYGAFHLCRVFIPLMSKNEYGRIVNISSGYGAMNEMAGNTAAYRISKAALNALTLIMAHELKDTNIKVNAVCPSWVSTDMGGSSAPVTPEEAAKDIVHFAIIDETGPSGGFFRYKKPIPW
ncbi:MAG TPA: SDR family oxidoreductase [Nitrososphaeraceae archaeon]|jgi:NAD(P)-dependent dehydrogenase (short-subunit alcohol dehydrogenase family)